MSASLTVLVMATADDPGLPRLEGVEGVRFVVAPGPEPPPEAKDAEVLFYAAGGARQLDRVLEEAPRLRWVQTRSAGIDHLLTPRLVNAPVTLTNARGVYSPALAEFVAAAALFFAKDLPRMRRSQAEGRWDPFEVSMLAGRTAVIVGYGDIGRASARVLHALGMEVRAVGRRAGGADTIVREVVPFTRLQSALGAADLLVITAPLTPETRGLVGRDALAALPPGAVLVNVARGPIVDEAALVDVLRHGRLRGAALDVFEREPLPAGHPFYVLDNVLLSPHCADRTTDFTAGATLLFLENLDLFRRGLPLRNVIDKTRGY